MGFFSQKQSGKPPSVCRGAGFAPSSPTRPAAVSPGEASGSQMELGNVKKGLVFRGGVLGSRRGGRPELPKIRPLAHCRALSRDSGSNQLWFEASSIDSSQFYSLHRQNSNET